MKLKIKESDFCKVSRFCAEIFSRSVYFNLIHDKGLDYRDIDFDFFLIQALSCSTPRVSVSSLYNFISDFFHPYCIDIYYDYVFHYIRESIIFHVPVTEDIKNSLLIKFEDGSPFFDTLYDKALTRLENTYI